MLKIVFWVVIFAQPFFAVTQKSVDWCDIGRKYCAGLDHVACFDPVTNDSFCKDVTIIEIPQEDKEEIVNLQNWHRDRVAAGQYQGIPFQASKMMKLEWSDSLEYLAQIWMLRCKKTELCSICYVDDQGRLPYGRLEHRMHGVPTVLSNITNTAHKVLYKMVETPIVDLINDIVHNKIKFEMEKKFVISKMLGGERIFNFFIDDMYKIGCALGHVPYKDDEEHTLPKFIELICWTALINNNRDDLHVFQYGPPCSECSKDEQCSKKYPNLCEYRRENLQNFNISTHKPKDDVDMITKNATDKTDKKDLILMNSMKFYNIIIFMGFIIFILVIFLILFCKYQCGRPRVNVYPLVHFSELNQNFDNKSLTKQAEAHPNRVLVY